MNSLYILAIIGGVGFLFVAFVFVILKGAENVAKTILEINKQHNTNFPLSNSPSEWCMGRQFLSHPAILFDPQQRKILIYGAQSWSVHDFEFLKTWREERTQLLGQTLLVIGTADPSVPPVAVNVQTPNAAAYWIQKLHTMLPKKDKK